MSDMFGIEGLAPFQGFSVWLDAKNKALPYLDAYALSGQNRRESMSGFIAYVTKTK